MTAEDRVALILGRTIIRAEALAAENESLRKQLEGETNGTSEPGHGGRLHPEASAS